LGKTQTLQVRAADLIDSVDWDHHVLGPRSAWPDALRMMVNTMLGSPESMYLVWGPDRTFLFNDAYIPILGPRLDSAMGARFEDLWADAWPSVESAFLDAEAGTSTRFTDMFVPMARYGEPEDTWWTFSYAPARDADDRIVGVVCITNETTDRVLIEQQRAAAIAQQDLLNHELSHRVKNTIAMVQALATQSLKPISDRAAVKAFEDRLVALGHAHNVLLQHSWQSASISSILATVLEVHNGRGQFVTEGPDVRLASSATVSLSLLLHELATNATKYGALSVETGQVLLRWEVAGDDFVLHWRETGGPPVAPPARKGFGSRLIGMGLCGTRNAKLTYPPTGFEATFSAPLARLGEE
jgi:two-component sensor histidine kinase